MIKYIGKLNRRAIWFSVGLVLLFSASFVEPARAQEASFYLSPSGGNYNVGWTFTVDVLINAQGVAINAAQATIHFPPEILKVVNISKNNSVFTLWIQEPVWSNTKGELSFVGGLPSPGFRGEAGKVVSIVFQGKAEGETKVAFSKEIITANDPRGTNVFSFSREGNYSIFPAKEVLPPVALPAALKVSSATHPDPEKWYSNNNPQFQWELSPEIIGISTAFNQESIFNPPSVSQGLFHSKSFESVKDGIWYFHIKFQNKTGWSRAVHFRVQIDTQPPYPFELIVDNEGDSTNPYPLLYFEAKDDTSGISHYEIKIGSGDFFRVSDGGINSLRLPHQAPGVHPIIFRAVDKAGNYRENSTEIKIKSIKAPVITVCPGTFISGEEILHLEGIALPDHAIIVFFKLNEKLIKKWEAKSNNEGEWSINEDGLFKSGNYSISSRAENPKGAISNPSEECFIKTILSGISVGPLIMSYETLVWIVIIVLILILILIFYFLKKDRATHRQIEKETQDLKHKFYKEYHELKVDIEQELELIRKLKGEKAMTAEEEKREEKLLKNLADLKRVLEKELKDIEKLG